MKKEISSDIEDELCPEYDLTKLLKGGIRGKYVARYRAGTNVVLLAPGVAQAFPTEDAVNEALRLVMRMAKIPTGIELARARMKFGKSRWPDLYETLGQCQIRDLLTTRPSAFSVAGSSISFLIIFPNAALSSSFDPTLMNRTTPRRSIKNVVGMLETE